MRWDIRQPPLTHNSRIVMRLLRDHGAQSRSVLSERSGLSPTTITKAVAPLLDRGWVVEAATRSGQGVGRPATPLHHVPEAITVCGIHISIGTARLGLTDASTDIKAFTEVGFDPAEPSEAVLEKVAVAATQLLADAPTPVLHVGVGVPGLVDPTHTINIDSTYLGWHNVDVRTFLERRLRLPIALENNARSMVLAEQRFGVLGVSTLGFMYVQRGVGLGMIMREVPLVGTAPAAPDAPPTVSWAGGPGHVRVEDPGEMCACGSSGCLETVICEDPLRRGLAAAGCPVPEAAADLLPMVDSHPAARALRARVIRGLSRVLATAGQLMRPDAFVLGGLYETCPDTLLADLNDAFLGDQRYLRPPIQIARASLPHPGLQGAAALALEAEVYGNLAQSS